MADAKLMQAKKEEESSGGNEDVFVPIQTEIFLSDTEIYDDLEDITQCEVDPLEVNDGDFKNEKVGHQDIPTNEIPNDSKDVEKAPLNIKIVKIEHLVEKKPELQRNPVVQPVIASKADNIIRLVRLDLVKTAPSAGSSSFDKERKSTPIVLLPPHPNYEVVKYGRNLLQRTLYKCKRCGSFFPKLIQVQRHQCPPKEEESSHVYNFDPSKSLLLGDRTRLSRVDRTMAKPGMQKAAVIKGLKDCWKTQLTCPDCGKKFLRKASLTVHLRSHSSSN